MLLNHQLVTSHTHIDNHLVFLQRWAMANRTLNHSTIQLDPARTILLRVGASIRTGATAKSTVMSRGIKTVCQITGRSIGSVYLWLYAKEKGGSGGWIPPEDAAMILVWAKKEGVDIDAQDFLPPPKAVNSRGCQHVG